MRVVVLIAVFLGGIVTCYLLLSLGVVDTIYGLPGSQSAPELSLPTYMSFVGVMMTSVTAVLAAVAIGIGVVAAYTFREIKDEARKVAAKTAQDKADEALSDQVILARIDEIAFRTGGSKSNELDQDFDPDDAGDR